MRTLGIVPSSRRTCAAMALGLAATALVPLSTAQAAPVQADNRYEILIGQGFGSAFNPSLFSATFDGIDETLSDNGRTVQVIETQTALSNGWSSLVVTVVGQADLAPVPGSALRVGIGVAGDGLDLDGHYVLENFSIGVFSPFEGYFETGDLADAYRSTYFSGAWDGTSGAGTTWGSSSFGGINVRSVQFFFTLSPLAPPTGNEVPAPGTLALAGLGLAALAAPRARVRSGRDGRRAGARAASGTAGRPRGSAGR